MITKNVRLYLGDGFPVRIPVSQYDTMWQFVFTIVNNSQPWQIPTGATAVLNGKKPDGNVFAFAGTIENNTVTVDADVQMTAVAGQTVCELSILADGKTVGTANFILDVEEAPKSADDVVSDTVLDGYGMMVTNAVDSWLNSHSGQIGGLTNEAKQALLTLLAHVAYTDDQGQAYLDALETALYPPVDLLSISAVFNQGDAVIYDTDELDTLKQYLTVTANMDDGTTQTVSNYTLSGTLKAGTSTITALYAGKTDPFDVMVKAAPLLNDILTLDGIQNTRSGHSANTTVWEDLSGNRRDFRLNAGTTVVWNDNAAVFDGTNTTREYVYSGVLLPTTLTEWTIELSVKVGNIGTSNSGYPIFGSNTNTWTDREDLMALIADSTKKVQAVWGSGVNINVSDEIAHITIVFRDDGKMHRYLNGAHTSTTEYAYNRKALGRSTHYLGGNQSLANKYFTGEIYRFGISSTAFSDEEIASRYESLAARFNG